MSSRHARSIRSWAGRLIAAGLGVQLVTFFWLDALSFVLFLALGGTFVGAGIVLFLYGLASAGNATTASTDGERS